MPSVEATVVNPGWQDNARLFAPLSTPELETPRIETSNVFLVGGITLDEALDKLKIEG